MDASKITELMQKRHTRVINRNNTVDSSTLIWQTQIQSSTYRSQPMNLPFLAVQGKQMSLTTGSTQRYPSVFSGAAGSASQIYSSDSITMQRAGQNSCSVPINTSNPNTSFITLPLCYCEDTNNDTTTGAINNQSNPYLPAFDTYYLSKTKCFPSQDENQRHYVQRCGSCVIEHSSNYTPINYTPYLIPFATIAKRQQWIKNAGYCGETSFITSAMYYGMYMSQYDVRLYASPNNPPTNPSNTTPTQNQPSDQVLIGTNNDIVAAGLFKMNYSRWIDSPQTHNDVNAFLTWMQGYTSTGTPVISVLFENTALLGTPPSTAQDEYDHIVSIISASTTSITFCDNGIVTPSAGEHVFNTNTNPMYFTYALPTAIRNRADSLASASEYSVPLLTGTYYNAAIALTGINTTETSLVRVQLTTTDDELTDMAFEGSNTRPPANDMTITVHMYGLLPNTTYFLYQYKDYALVPTANFNQTYINLASPLIIKTVINSPSNPPIDTTLVLTIQSSDTAIFRCVPSTAA